MDRREALQALLESIVGETGKVYFQPPTGTLMTYPCISYQPYISKTEFADNLPYRYSKRYQLTVIYRDPDNPIPDAVAQLPSCVHNRFFVVDNLNHSVFELYY